MISSENVLVFLSAPSSNARPPLLSPASDGTFMSTAEHIRLPDDCTVGYIVEALLGVSLIRSALFHSHLENLGLVSDTHSQVHSHTHTLTDTLTQTCSSASCLNYVLLSVHQVTLSYGTVENSRNTVYLKGAFSIDEDPTR